MTKEQTELDLQIARAARDEGVDRVDTSSHQQWVDAVDAEIRHLADFGLEFTSDDVRAAGLGEPHHDNAWGARFIAAKRRGEIVRVGYRQSTRPAGHARPVSIWRGTGAA